jgi:hypothetical protein
MTDFDTGQFIEWVVDKLDTITGLEVVLSNPSGDSKFPCAVVSTPLRRVVRTEDGVPVEIDISVQIDYWAGKKYDVMDLSDQGDIKLREYNLTRVNTTIDTFDEITKKYRYGGNYEVKYNAITNSYMNIR